MSEQEKITFINLIDRGLKQSYDDLVRRKAALGQDMVIADANGQPVTVPAAEILMQKVNRNNES